MSRRRFLSNNPEDLKLLTLAKSTMARSNSSSAAALRDNSGRTYVAVPVKSGNFEIDALLAVLVVAKASGITGIEAIVIAGQAAPDSSIAIVRAEDSAAELFAVSDKGDLITIE